MMVGNGSLGYNWRAELIPLWFDGAVRLSFDPPPFAAARGGVGG